MQGFIEQGIYSKLKQILLEKQKQRQKTIDTII